MGETGIYDTVVLVKKIFLNVELPETKDRTSRRSCLCGSLFCISFYIITLGESVVFNYKKYDYETVFLERGVRKNIGVFSPIIDDTVYVCKLLVENFKSSPKKDSYKHYLI